MTVLTATAVPNNTAVNVAAVSVGTAPTQIAPGSIGANGALVQILNGSGSSMTVTVEDPTFTGAGNAPSEPAQSITNGSDRWFRILPANIDPATGYALLTLSTVTTVTYRLIPG
jgi:hypothetical protein